MHVVAASSPKSTDGGTLEEVQQEMCQMRVGGDASDQARADCRIEHYAREGSVDLGRIGRS